MKDVLSILESKPLRPTGSFRNGTGAQTSEEIRYDAEWIKWFNRLDGDDIQAHCGKLADAFRRSMNSLSRNAISALIQVLGEHPACDLNAWKRLYESEHLRCRLAYDAISECQRRLWDSESRTLSWLPYTDCPFSDLPFCTPANGLES